MSSNTTGAANSQLPDEDALAAFATGAFAGNGRKRRRDTSKTQESTATAAVVEPEQKDLPQEEKSSSADPAATGTQDKPEPAPAPPVGEESAPRVAVPSPSPEPQASTPQPAPEPATAPEQAEDTSASTSGRGGTSAAAEVAVRAVPVPVTRTPVPPALRGETVDVQVPTLGPAGARATQCTIMVSQNVRDRFAHYQLSKKMAGEREPSNALVVRRAFLHAKRADLFGKLLADVYHQHNAVEEEDYDDEDGLLGEVVGRRAVRGRLKDSGQQSFRPSEQELATYDAFTQGYGFPSRSDFLNAVLDEFLPQLPASSRRR